MEHLALQTWYKGAQTFTVKHIGSQAYIEKLERCKAQVKYYVNDSYQKIEINFTSLGKTFKAEDTFSNIERRQKAASKSMELYNMYTAVFRQLHILRYAFQDKNLWDLIYEAEELEAYENGQGGE